jgi:hypothetical protein
MRNALQRARNFGAIFERVRVYHPKKRKTLLGTPVWRGCEKRHLREAKGAQGLKPIVQLALLTARVNSRPDTKLLAE